MSRLSPLALMAAVAALSACSSVGRVASAVNPFDGGDRAAASPSVPQDGRISILTFEQDLAPSPELSGHAIVPPAPITLNSWNNPGGTADNSPGNSIGSGGLEIAWRESLGAGSNKNTRLSAPPVIAEGKLFFLNADQEVVALDVSNGHRLWSHRMRPEHTRDRNAIGGGVAAEGGRVFVTTGYGTLVALDANTGDQVWSVQGDAPFHSAPTVLNARVYAVSNDSQLLAVDAGDGRILWNYSAIAEPARILAASSPAVDGDSVIAPFASGEVVALLTANGRRLWVDALSRTGRLTSLSAINDIAGRPVVENGVVYAASHSGVLAAIDLRTGQRMWARSFASTQTPWISGDVLYAINTDGELAAFDRTNGNVYWVKQLRRFEDEHDRRGRVAWTGPIMVGNVLYLANSLGEVVTVAPQTGDIGTTRDVGSPVFIPPIAASGQIYVVTDDARLIALH